MREWASDLLVVDHVDQVVDGRVMDVVVPDHPLLANRTVHHPLVLHVHHHLTGHHCLHLVVDYLVPKGKKEVRPVVE